MLYDPKWETEIKADPFSLESLIAWLEKQPAGRTYNYCDKSSCLIAQYLKANGIKDYALDAEEVRALGWEDIVNPEIYIPTYGAALKRARAMA